MKKIHQLLLAQAILMASCKTAPKELEETEITHSKTTVETVRIKQGSVENELVLSATSIYLKRNVVTATIPAFITSVRIKLGDAVTKGDILFELESKERRALGVNAAQLDTSLVMFGIVRVKASATGVISTLDKQQPGDYVLEGTQLCTIAESNDLAFQVNVPYEYTEFTRSGKKCNIILPDNSLHTAQFTRPLTSMNVLAQTQIVLAKINEPLLLPENMIVKVSIDKGLGTIRQILPKSCILSDEMMKEFWVLKLINDTTAIKVPVSIGNKNSEKAEILSPVFDPNEQILSTGNYGLPDTSFVNVIKHN